MIGRLIEWSVRQRLVVLLAALAIALGSAWAAFTTPVDAIPDLSDVQVIVMTEWRTRSPTRCQRKC